MKDKNEGSRKARKWGTISQKMMSFRIDLDLVNLLNGEANKGRLINNLLRKHYGAEEYKKDEDSDPDENSIEEYLT